MRKPLMSKSIKKELNKIIKGESFTIKRTKMRVPVKDGVEDWDNAEKVSEKIEEIKVSKKH